MMVLLFACSSPYYNVMERWGIPKRDILVDRVEAARDSQEKAAEQFKDVLEKINMIVAVMLAHAHQVFTLSTMGGWALDCRGCTSLRRWR